MRIGGRIFSMVRICTGEVCVRSSKPLALRLFLLPRDEQRVLRVARRMIRRKIQGFEIVVIRFDDGAFGYGIAELLEDRDNLTPRSHDGMLGADGATDAGQTNVNDASVFLQWARCEGEPDFEQLRSAPQCAS